MDTFAWIGAIAGLVGGITGLLGFGFQVWFYFATGPKIALSGYWAFNLQKTQECLNIEVVNKGRMTARLQTISILYSTTQHTPLALFPDGDILGPTFPHSIESHSSGNWLIPLDSLRAAVVHLDAIQSIKIRVVLATGNSIESKWIDLPIESS